MEEAGEENDRPYNLRQRKTVQRYEAPPIGSCLAHLFVHHSHSCTYLGLLEVCCVTANCFILLLRACEQKAEQRLTF